MLAGQRPLFAALLELVSAGGVAGYVEKQQKSASWQTVHSLLDPNQRLVDQHPPRGSTNPIATSSVVVPIAKTAGPAMTPSQPGGVRSYVQGAAGTVAAPTAGSMSQPSSS